MDIRTPSGHPIKAVWHCPDYPDHPGLCAGECFKKFHTMYNFTDMLSQYVVAQS